jgi:hypothetical protein
MEIAMQTGTTLNSVSSKNSSVDEATVVIRDRILGALYASRRGTSSPVNLAEIRERLTDVNGSDFERVIASLDREGVIVVDRGADATFVKLIQSGLAAEAVPCYVKDRVLGAIYSAARGPMRFAPIHELRERVGDLGRIELDRALVTLALQGDIELGRGMEQGWVRIAPYAYGMAHPYAYGMAHPYAYGTAQPYAYGTAQPYAYGTTHSYPYGATYSYPYGATYSYPYGTPAYAPTSPTYRAQVERVAHQLWEQRGRMPGYDIQNWADAEHMVRQQLCGTY